MNEKLNRANKLQEQIKELEKFLSVVTEFDEKSTALQSVRCWLNKKVKLEVSLFGIRDFGVGSHSQEVIVPDSIRNIVIISCKERLKGLKDELFDLIGE